MVRLATSPRVCSPRGLCVRSRRVAERPHVPLGLGDPRLTRPALHPRFHFPSPAACVSVLAAVAAAVFFYCCCRLPNAQCRTGCRPCPPGSGRSSSPAASTLCCVRCVLRRRVGGSAGGRGGVGRPVGWGSGRGHVGGRRVRQWERRPGWGRGTLSGCSHTVLSLSLSVATPSLPPSVPWFPILLSVRSCRWQGNLCTDEMGAYLRSLCPRVYIVRGDMDEVRLLPTVARALRSALRGLVWARCGCG